MIKRMRLVHSLAGLVLALTACTSSAAPSAEASRATAAAPARHPESGLVVVPLTVKSGTKAHRFRVEVAGTSEEQAKGLMFRTAMGADEGMIFPRRTPAPASFWMRNTVIPLDIIFVGADGRILNIVQGVPYSEQPLRSAGPVKGILELNGGRAAQLGIKPGDLVEW